MSGPWGTVAGAAGPLRVYSTAEPAGGEGRQGRVVLLCHDLPRARAGGNAVAQTFPSLADRLAEETGWRTVAATLRGAGGSAGSAGDFSVEGWLEDLDTVMTHVIGADGSAWLVGFGLGGALALRRAVTDARVRGLACLGTAADLSGYAARPPELVDRCRASGVIRDAAFPADPAAWAAELGALQPVEAAAALGDRPLLVVHGADDPDVPTAAARALVDAAGGPAELRIVFGAGHSLWADPRVVATLVGWIERQQ